MPMTSTEPQRSHKLPLNPLTLLQALPQYLGWPKSRHTDMDREYALVPDFFIQSSGDKQTNFEAIPERFGLLDASKDRWSKLFKRIKQLNDADPKASYKVIFFGRHGEGYHNAALDKYGLDEWNRHWAKQEGDGETIWGPDAELTETGKKQAKQAHDMWENEIASGLSLPDKLYCSPMTRALQTYEITFNGILPPRYPKAIVLENLREEHGLRLCDKRRSRTYIQTKFPKVTIEKDMSEEDTIWDPEKREGKEYAALRFKAALDTIFETRKPFISITGHVGILSGFLVSLGKEPYYLNPGGVYAMVIKSTITTNP